MKLRDIVAAVLIIGVAGGAIFWILQPPEVTENPSVTTLDGGDFTSAAASAPGQAMASIEILDPEQAVRNGRPNALRELVVSRADKRQALPDVPTRFQPLLRRALESGELRIEELPPLRLKGSVLNFAMNRDGSRIVVLGRDLHQGIMACEVWTTNPRKMICRIDHEFSRGYRENAVCLSPDGKLVAVGEIGSAYVFDADTGEKICEHNAADGEVTHVAISVDNEWLSFSDSMSGLHGYPVRTGFGGSMTSRDKATHVAREWISGADPNGYSLADHNGSAMSIVHPRDPELQRKYNGVVGRYGRGTKATAAVSTMIGSVTVSPLAATHYPLASEELQQSAMHTWEMYSNGLVDPCTVGLDIDARVIVIADEVGRVEFHPAGRSVTVIASCLPVDEKLDTAISQNGHMIARQDLREQLIELWQVKNLPLDGIGELSAELHRSVVNRDFEAIDALMSDVATSEIRMPGLPELALDSALVELLEARSFVVDGKKFGSLDWKSLYEQWVDAHPSTVAGRVLLAGMEITDAWSRRGSGFINTVSEEDLKAFREGIERATELLAPIDKSRATVQYFRHLLTISKAQSWDFPLVNAIVEDLMKTPAASDFELHTQVSESLLRRWGGADGLSKEYIEGICEQLPEEVADELYVRLATRLICFFGFDAYPVRTGFEYDDLLKRVAKIEARDPDNAVALNAGFRLAVAKGDAKIGQEYLTKLQKYRPPFQPQIWLTVKNYEAAKNWIGWEW